MKGTQVLAVAMLIVWCVHAEEETRTDLSRDVYIGNSATDFALQYRLENPRRGVCRFVVFDIPKGDFRLLCFVDGLLSQDTKLQLPGSWEMSTRGLKKGQHRVTIQVIDKEGRIGGATHTIAIR